VFEGLIRDLYMVSYLHHEDRAYAEDVLFKKSW
jgi:hypothetical protein